jgi:predicted AlkP superfamily pyrophosphatase or phosphodiesterase
MSDPRSNCRLLLALACLLLSPQGITETHQRHLVLISIDGLRPEIYLRTGELGLRLPNLSSIKESGVYAERMTGVLPTVTYPSHTTMVTGVPPSVHGIIDNHKKTGEAYLQAADIRVPTLWEVAQKAGLTTAIVTWPASYGAAVDFLIPENLSMGVADVPGLIRAGSSPGLFERLEATTGEVDLPSFEQADAGEKLDAMTADFAAQVLREHRPRLLLAHFLDADHWQHIAGPDSAEAYRAFERVDAHIGTLIDAAKAAGIFADTYFLIVGDHGFVSIHTGLNVLGLLFEAGVIAVKEDGTLAADDIEARARGGAATFYLSDAASAGNAEHVSHSVQQLIAKRYRGVIEYASDERLAEMGGFPDASFALFASDGYFFTESSLPAVTLPPPQYDGRIFSGSHGYAPQLPAMDTGFLLRGPGIRSNYRFRGLRMIDVAPTAAELLGLKMPGVSGIALVGLRR